MNLTFWHRSWDGEVWTNITDNVQVTTLNFSDTLDNDPFTFGFNLHDRIKNSDTPLGIEDGDLIAVTENNNTGGIAQNGKLVGRIDLDKNIRGADYVNFATKPWRFENDITCKEFDFSDYKLHDFPELSSDLIQGYKDVSFTSILDDILIYSNELLGGILGTFTIDKYKLNIADFTVKSYREQQLSTRQALVKLLNDEKLYFKLRWFAAADATNGIKAVAQIQIFDRMGLSPYHPSWSLQGVNDNVIKTGKITIPNSNPLVPSDYYCCKDIDLNTDKDIIRNHIIMDANIVFNEDAFDDLDSALERYIFTSTGVKNFNYTLPYPALDIKYVGFLVRSNVTSEATPTTSTFSVPDYDVESFNIGDVIRVVDATDGTENIRLVFDANTTTNVITVSEVLTFTPETNDLVEVINQEFLDIFEDNQVNYASIGVVKELEADKPAKIRFLDLSEPPPGIEVVVYYYRVQKYKDQPFNQASIQRYGLKTEKVKLKGIFTIDQIRQITQQLLITEPNRSISFLSYRPSEAGMILPVDISQFYTGNLIATEVSAEFKGKKDSFDYWEYSITLSELRETIEDILRRINNSYNPERPSGANNNRIVQRETINVITGLSTTKTVDPYLDALIYYAFDGNYNDSSGNINNATNYGGASVSGNYLTLGNNITDYLTTPTTAYDGLGDFTITFWGRINTLHTLLALGEFSQNVILSCARTTVFNNAFTIMYEYADQTTPIRAWSFRIENAVYRFSSDTTIEDLDWHYITFTRSGANLSLYIDNVLVETIVATNTSINLTGGTCIIGQEQDSLWTTPGGGSFDVNQCWAGNIDNFALYDRVLTDVERTTLYNSAKSF